MFAPVISLFAIIGVAMVRLPAGGFAVRRDLSFYWKAEIGGFVLGIFVPPGEGLLY